MNAMERLVKSQNIVLNVNQMILDRKKQCLSDQHMEENFLFQIGTEINNLEMELFHLKLQLLETSKVGKNAKRKLDGVKDADSITTRVENTKNGQLVITKKVRFESEASSSKSGNDQPIISEEVTSKNNLPKKNDPQEVASKKILPKMNDSNIVLHMIRHHDNEGKQRKLSCFGKKRIVLGDSQMLRLTGNNKSNQTDLKLPHPCVILAQSGLRLSDLTASFVFKRFCSCCTPCEIFIALGVNDLVKKIFTPQLVSKVVNVLTVRFGRNTPLCFIPPFLPEHLQKKFEGNINQLDNEILKLREDGYRVSCTEYIDHKNIQFQNKNDLHIDWKHGRDIWSGVLTKAMVKMNKEQWSERVSESDKMESDELDLGADISEILPIDAYQNDEEEDSSSNKVPMSNTVKVDKLKEIFDDLSESKLVHHPNCLIRFSYIPTSCYLSNYEEKSQFIHQIWLTTDDENKNNKYLFFNFDFMIELGREYGNIKYLIKGKIERIFWKQGSPDYLILSLEGLEIWSQKPNLRPSKIFSTPLDPHNNLDYKLYSAVNIGQTKKPKFGESIPPLALTNNQVVAISVVRSGPKSLAKFDFDPDQQIWATSEFFCQR